MNPELKEHKFPSIKPMPWDKIFKNRKVPEHFIDLISKLLVYNPSLRLTAEKALEHIYFDEIRNIKVVDGKYKDYDIPKNLQI